MPSWLLQSHFSEAFGLSSVAFFSHVITGAKKLKQGKHSPALSGFGLSWSLLGQGREPGGVPLSQQNESVRGDPVQRRDLGRSQHPQAGDKSHGRAVV